MIDLPAVPNAINSGSKFMVFRVYKGDEQKHVDKGFYYKIVSNSDLKLLRWTLEENGYL